MNRSRLLLVVASVLAGTTVLLVILGAVFNIVIALFSVPFGITAYFIWFHATGRLQERIQQGFRTSQYAAREPSSGRNQRQGSRNETSGSRNQDEPHEAFSELTRTEAFRILGVPPSAGKQEIRRAYREKAKRFHPDTDNGDEETFKQVTVAYDRLRGD